MPGEGLFSYIDLLLATYLSIRGPLGPIQAERKLVKAEYTISELDRRCPRLNIRNMAEHGVTEVEKKSET
jgi:hypothetical protein